VAAIPEDRRQGWLEICECAYSRLEGREMTLDFETGRNGSISIKWNSSGKKHTEGYLMQAGARDVDYSDFTFLKDLEIHGGRGVLMQGPKVPLFPSKP
jgi:hypothetical protein